MSDEKIPATMKARPINTIARPIYSFIMNTPIDKLFSSFIIYVAH